MERILVCGGRDFGSTPNQLEYCPYEQYAELLAIAKAQRKFLEKVLDGAKRKYDIECIIEGGARGADRIAGEWADTNLITRICLPADWKTHGNKAGPIRNQSMLDEQAPTLVIAFPGGAGTQDMIRRAKKAGVKVIEVKYG